MRKARLTTRITTVTVGAVLRQPGGRRQRSQDRLPRCRGQQARPVAGPAGREKDHAAGLLGIQDGTGKSAAMISEDSTAGTFGITVTQAAYVADKWKVPYAKSVIPVGSPTTDFTPYTQAILHSNGGKAPDVVFHVTTAPNVIGVENALNRAGYQGPQEDAVTYDPSYLSNPSSRAALEGGYVFIQDGIGLVAFPSAHQNSVACGSLVQISGGKYVEKVPLTCFKNTPLSILGSS